MADPIAAHVAAALVTGAMGALSDGTRALITKLAGVVRERFRQRSSDQDTLVAATRDPGDEAALRHLAEALSAHMRDDPAFAQQVREIWEQVAPEIHREDVTNTISGPVHGSVVQARDVQGGIGFGQVPPADPPPR